MKTRPFKTHARAISTLVVATASLPSPRREWLDSQVSLYTLDEGACDAQGASYRAVRSCCPAIYCRTRPRCPTLDSSLSAPSGCVDGVVVGWSLVVASRLCTADWLRAVALRRCARHVEHRGGRRGRDGYSDVQRRNLGAFARSKRWIAHMVDSTREERDA